MMEFINCSHSLPWFIDLKIKKRLLKNETKTSPAAAPMESAACLWQERFLPLNQFECAASGRLYPVSFSNND
jgi:hypothetical protein